MVAHDRSSHVCVLCKHNTWPKGQWFKMTLLDFHSSFLIASIGVEFATFCFTCDHKMNSYLGIHYLKSAQKEVRVSCYLWGKKGIQAGTFRLEITGVCRERKEKKKTNLWTWSESQNKHCITNQRLTSLIDSICNYRHFRSPIKCDTYNN